MVKNTHLEWVGSCSSPRLEMVEDTEMELCTVGMVLEVTTLAGMARVAVSHEMERVAVPHEMARE